MLDEKILNHILNEMELNLLNMINELLSFPSLGTSNPDVDNFRKIFETKIAQQKFFIEWIRAEMNGFMP